MSPFESLPAPLPLLILQELHDLKSLDALRRASPVYNYVFAQHAVAVVEHIMARSLIPDVISKVRLYIIFLSHDGMQRPEKELLWTFTEQAKWPLIKSTPGAAIRHTLARFSHYATVCDGILQRKLVHLYRSPLERIDNRQAHSDYLSGRPVRSPPPALPYPAVSPAPIYWAEQQRVLRAFLRWQLSRRFKIPLLHDTKDLPPGMARWAADEVDEVIESYNELKAAHEDPTPLTEILSWSAMVRPPPPAADASDEQKAWAETFEQQAQAARGLTRGQQLFNMLFQRWHGSPLRSADWTVMRRLGFGIWSTARLAELHLTSYPLDVDPPNDPYAHQVSIGDDAGRSRLMFTWWKLYLAELASRAAERARAADRARPP